MAFPRVHGFTEGSLAKFNAFLCAHSGRAPMHRSGCGSKAGRAKQERIFDEDGEAQRNKAFGQQLVLAGSKLPEFREGKGWFGDTGSNRECATFEQVYDGSYLRRITWLKNLPDAPLLFLVASITFPEGFV